MNRLLMSALNNTAQDYYQRGEKKSAVMLLRECLRIIDSGKWWHDETILHGVIESFSVCNLFEESLPMRRKFYELSRTIQHGDRFMRLAAELQLGRALWLSGKHAAARKLLLESESDYQLLLKNCKTEGGLEWVARHANWLTEAGIPSGSGTSKPGTTVHLPNQEE
jgi:hypothetical protein